MDPAPTPAEQAKDPDPAWLQPAREVGVLAALRRFDRWIQRVEVAVCLGALATMVLLAFAQVLLRQAAGASLGPISLPSPVAWFDNVARHMVIWVGVLGASLATSEGRHISIEAVPKLLGPAGRRRVDVLVNLTSATGCAILLGLAWVYMVRVQLPNEAHLFHVEALDLKVYRWPFLTVVPVGLALMVWRFLLRAAEGLGLSDADYDALRATEQEVEELETEEVKGLAKGEGEPEPAQEQPAQDGPAPASLADARRALSSSTWDSQEGPIPRDEDDLADESEEGAALDPDSEPAARALPREMPSIRSTDEIPIYQDLADAEDLREPEARRGAPLLDSSEELEAVGIEDLVEGDPARELGRTAQEEVEAMARSTDRIVPAPSPSDSGPIGLGEASTDRLERPDLPPRGEDTP